MRTILLVLSLSACSALTLRPVNPVHWQRKTEVTEKLGIEEPKLDAVVAAEQAECDSLDRKVLGWTAATITLGALGGGSGITAIFTEDTSRYVTGGISVGLAAFSALASFLSTQYAQRYSRRCTVNLDGR